LLFLDDKGRPFLLAAVAQAVSTLLIGFVLVYLLRSALDRGSETPRVSRLAVWFGAAAVAVALVGLQIATMIQAHDFATSADQSTAAAHAASRSSWCRGTTRERTGTLACRSCCAWERWRTRRPSSRKARSA
jgi:hypothetical protein